ncbi:MAG: peptidylprolyl isomerase [Gemmatimonadota bacterium]
MIRVLNRGLVTALCLAAAACTGEPGEDDGADDSAVAPGPKVEIQTSQGRMVVELFPDRAPISVENFLAYVDEGFYDGLVFHRVVPGWVVQGGGFKPGLEEQAPTREPIQNESDNGLINSRGTLAMARMPAAHSATSQFYINVSNNSMLDFGAQRTGQHGYAVLGTVVEGLDVVDAISGVEIEDRGQMQGVPVEPVTIDSIRRLP